MACFHISKWQKNPRLFWRYASAYTCATSDDTAAALLVAGSFEKMKINEKKEKMKIPHVVCLKLYTSSNKSIEQ